MKENSIDGNSNLNPANIPPAIAVPSTTPPANAVPSTTPPANVVPITIPPVSAVPIAIPPVTAVPITNPPPSGSTSNTIPAQQFQPHPPHYISPHMAYLSAVARVTLELKHEIIFYFFLIF